VDARDTIEATTDSSPQTTDWTGHETAGAEAGGDPMSRSADQRKIREAQELVNAAKQEERAAWEAKWKAQQADPEYQRQSAERRAKSEERSRKIAINKENKFLAYAERVKMEFGCSWGSEEYHTAVHEAGHAVLQEVIGGGCLFVTVLPQELKKGRGDHKETTSVLGFSRGAGSSDHIVDAIINVAGVVATQFAGLGDDSDAMLSLEDDDDDEDNYDDGGGGDRENLGKNMDALGIKGAYARWTFQVDVHNKAKLLFNQPYVRSALFEIAEALVVNKNLSGGDVKAIIKKHQFAGTPVEDMFQFDAGRQYKFHFRKDWLTPRRDKQVPFVITFGDKTYGQGYDLARVNYADEKAIEKMTVWPEFFFVRPATQLSLFDKSAIPARKERSRKEMRDGDHNA
jgi:hypothetical protein